MAFHATQHSDACLVRESKYANDRPGVRAWARARARARADARTFLDVLEPSRVWAGLSRQLNNEVMSDAQYIDIHMYIYLYNIYIYISGVPGPGALGGVQKRNPGTRGAFF